MRSDEGNDRGGFRPGPSEPAEPPAIEKLDGLAAKLPQDQLAITMATS